MAIRAEAEALNMLKIRYGRPYEPELQANLEKKDDVAVSWLCIHEHWAVRACGLVLAREGLAAKRINFSTGVEACRENLEHEQTKTRIETIDLLAQLASHDKRETWRQFGTVLSDLVERNIALDLEERGMEAERIGLKETKQDEEDRDVIHDGRLPIELEISKTKRYSCVNLSEFRGRVRANSSGASARIRLDSGAVVLMVHETVGWKALETSLKGLNKVIAAYGTDFVSEGLVTPRLVSLFDQVLEHENRFVREVGLQLAETFSRITVTREDSVVLPEALQKVREELYHSIALGICDGNGQVRYAACNAARALIETRPGPPRELDELETVLGPVICLNRHYNADGIRAVCMSTWRSAFPQGAIPVISRRADIYIEVYLAEMNTSKDDLAREACCFACGELATKVQGTIVETNSDTLAKGCMGRFKDSSWTVRAAACNAIASIVTSYSERLKELVLSQLYDALVERLADPIWSVRDEAAVTMAALVKCYPDSLLLNILDLVKEWLPRARVHDESHRHHSHHTSAQCAEDQNEIQIVYSCCSAEPNVHFSKLPKKEWQFSDGALRLLREIVKQNPEKVDAVGLLNNLEHLFEGLRIHNAKGSCLEETAIECIIPIAEALGKRPFKRYLDPLLPAVMNTLGSNRHRAAHSAALLCDFLKRFLGENIFKARLESIDPHYVDLVARTPASSFEAPRVSFRE